MKSTTSPLSFVIALLIAAAGLYWYFFTGTEQPPLIAADGSENQAQTTFQALLSELQPISFDTSIFSDVRFNALVDITTPISPETSGRLDPFASVAGMSGN